MFILWVGWWGYDCAITILHKYHLSLSSHQQAVAPLLVGRVLLFCWNLGWSWHTFWWGFWRSYGVEVWGDVFEMALLHQCHFGCQGEYLSHPLTRQSTALPVLRIQLFLHISFYLPGCQLYFSCEIGRRSQIGFGPHEKYFGFWNCSFDLSVPLNKGTNTTFFALTKEEGSTTEKAMRKTSVLG